MLNKIFWEDPYQTTLETTLRTVCGNTVTLDETIFYALSGGQESDAGTIGGQPVLEARKEGFDILYTLPEDHGLKAGDRVRVAIDWERRYRLMRLHFAAELVLEVVYRQFEGIGKIGAHIAEDKARLDFGWPVSLSEHFPLITEKVQALIDADRVIRSNFSDEKAQRRTWEVEGFALIPCGGTHLKRTSEVGAIRLKRKNIGKGKERIEVYVDP